MTLRSLISLAASAALALLSTGLAAQINGGDCGTWVEIPGKALLPGGVAEDRPVRARRFADGSLALRSPLTVLADGGEGAYAEGDHGYVSILNNIFLLEGGQRRACYEADVFSRCASAFRAAEAAGFKSGTARFCVSGFEVEPVVEGNMLLECGDYLWVIGDGRGRLKRSEPKLNAAGQMVTSYISHTALMHRANARAKGMPLDSLSIPVAVYPESQPWPGQLVWAQHRDAAGTARNVVAVGGDTGPAFGSGSIAMHQLLVYGEPRPQKLGPIPADKRCQAGETDLPHPFATDSLAGPSDSCEAKKGNVSAAAEIRAAKSLPQVDFVILPRGKFDAKDGAINTVLSTAVLRQQFTRAGYTDEQMRQRLACLDKP